MMTTHFYPATTAQNPSVKAFFDAVTGTWSYVVYQANSPQKACAIVDSLLDFDPAAGSLKTTSADALIAFVKEEGLEVEWLLETHIHADHLTATHYIKQQLGGKTGISKQILTVLKTWEPLLNNAADTPLDGRQFDVLFEDGESFCIGDMPAQLLNTPGHTPADSVYVVGDAVFTGDVLFLPDVGSGRCDFPGGSADAAYESLQRLMGLEDTTRVFVGHDYPPAKRPEPQCMATLAVQKAENFRLKAVVQGKEAFVAARNVDDFHLPVPRLLLPSIQVNLRAGALPAAESNGVQYLRIPLNLL